jgi:beta-glucosidase
MGLFEDPFPASTPDKWPKLIHTPEALQIAAQLDRESIVLLENRNAILPLQEGLRKIAVIGPFSNTVNVSKKFDASGSGWRFC